MNNPVLMIAKMNSPDASNPASINLVLVGIMILLLVLFLAGIIGRRRTGRRLKNVREALELADRELQQAENRIRQLFLKEAEIKGGAEAAAEPAADFAGESSAAHWKDVEEQEPLPPKPEEKAILLFHEYGMTGYWKCPVCCAENLVRNRRCAVCGRSR